MSQTNTVSTLNGFFKEIYADELQQLVPDNAVLTKMIKFSTKEKLGSNFNCPVLLGRENGATYLAAGAGRTALNTAIAATMKNAQVPGSQIILSGEIDFEAAAKASTSKEAFGDSTELLVKNLMESAVDRLEIAMLYGHDLGTADSSVNTDSTHTVVTLSTATWAPGIWAGKEGAKLDAYNGASQVGSAAFTIDSIDVDNRALTLSGASGDISALDTQLGSGSATLVFTGSKGSVMSGINDIVTNTGSLFGISASTYTLWKGNSYSAGSAALTMAKILKAVSKAVGKGGLKEDVVCLVNPDGYANLNADQAALRQYGAESKASNGFESIDFRGQSGKISVVSHSMVKEGDAFILPMKRVKRVGACDVTFARPDKDDSYFYHVPGYNVYALDVYVNQAVFIEQPAKCVKITSIVNS